MLTNMNALKLSFQVIQTPLPSFKHHWHLKPQLQSAYRTSSRDFHCTGTDFIVFRSIPRKVCLVRQRQPTLGLHDSLQRALSQLQARNMGQAFCSIHNQCSVPSWCRVHGVGLVTLRISANSSHMLMSRIRLITVPSWRSIELVTLWGSLRVWLSTSIKPIDLMMKTIERRGLPPRQLLM